MVRRLVLIVLVIFVSSVSEATPCPPAFARFARPKVPSQRQIELFNQEIKNPLATIQALNVDPSVIESVGKIHLHGAFAGLTVEVQTSDGPKFLKVIDGLSLAATAQGHVIQNALARQNLAPQVTGYLSPKDVKALLRKFPELDEGDADVKLTYGVLMDRLDSASSRVGLNETPPSTWSKSDLEDTVRTLEATMAKLRIFPPQDLQFTFDRSGQFWLYDFDAYGHVSKSGAVTNLDSPKGDRTLEDFIRNRYIEVLVESKKRPTDRFFVDSAGHFRVRLERLRHQLFEMPLN